MVDRNKVAGKTLNQILYNNEKGIKEFRKAESLVWKCLSSESQEMIDSSIKELEKMAGCSVCIYSVSNLKNTYAFIKFEGIDRYVLVQKYPLSKSFFDVDYSKNEFIQ